MDVREKQPSERRLIDASAMRDDWLENGENEYVYDTNAVLDSIDSQPTVDAVEVVRKPVKGYEGYYEVDQFERVFGLERIIKVNDNGRNYKNS